jgi:hypothetical protein
MTSPTQRRTSDTGSIAIAVMAAAFAFAFLEPALGVFTSLLLAAAAGYLVASIG